MAEAYKIAYWIRTDVQHFAHIRPVYDSLGGVILTKNPAVYDFMKKKFPYLLQDLRLVKNSTHARLLLNKLNTKVVVYTGFQMIFWGYSVQVFHGASDKHYLLKHHRILLYDLLLLPGRKHMDKIISEYDLKHPERFKIVGYPKFDKLVSNTLSYSPMFDNGKPTILYAPTWISQGSGSRLSFSDHGESSLPIWGEKLIRAIAPRWNLIIKYHSRVNPNRTEIYDEIDQCIQNLDAEHSVKVVWDSDITQYMHQADIMISDISAVCYEWFHLKKPIIFANPTPDRYKPSSDNLSNTYAWQAGDVLYEEKDIVPAIEENLKEDKYKSIRNDLLEHSFHQPDGHATERQVAEVVTLYNKVKRKNRFQMACHNISAFIIDSIRHNSNLLRR